MARVLKFEITGPIARLVEQFEDVHFGDRRDDVDAALKVLVDQIAECSRAIDVAVQRHRIDMALAEQSAAEERLAELEAS